MLLGNTMNKIAILATLPLFFLISQVAIAEVFTIDGKVRAYFPGSPRYIGNIGQGKYEHEGYNYPDADGGLVYTLGVHVGTLSYNAEDTKLIITNYLKGQALSAKANIDWIEIGVQGNENQANFAIDSEYEGILVRKLGSVIYDGSHFYQWSV